MKFDQKYNHDAFAEFLQAFLPEDYIEKEKDIADLSRCKIITKARELGHVPSLNTYVLEMSHAKETDPRVSIATDAFKILATFGYDKALVIFKNPESDNYRFSYLTISLDLNEKNRVVARYSNARRYSFYLGVGAKTKTPEQQLVKYGRVKDVDDLLSRFSLEVVNKQFYLEIAKFFDELVDERGIFFKLPFQSDSTVRKNFAIRLIGRLMFCWFLKQKKSKDGQLISDDLLSANAVKENYYHAILEPLFFEILNTQINERDIRSYLYDKVPYLNGGLFSPQRDDYYDLDRTTFTSRHINTLRIADVWFREFFAFLETYNFTIDENTVFDQELSVDPEMLGRIFENLLAEINPETGTSERKRTGSFYTPRQIVEYMVDQSLLTYLKDKTGIAGEKLGWLISYDQEDDVNNPLSAEEKDKIIEAIISLRVLDPACGSGAFPVGILQKIVYILQYVDADCSAWIDKKLRLMPDLWKQRIKEYYASHPANYIRKLDIIKGSIFGVDIQPIAVEVSRLRCFLTLVVESKIDDAAPNRGIEPLPNLEFKFVCANTLIALPETTNKGMFDDHAGIEALTQIMGDYFTASSSKKEEIKLKFTRTQNEILSKAITTFGQSTGELTQKLTYWDPFGNTSSTWFDPKWMFGIEDGFDVVIGNPPYVSTEKIQGELKELYKRDYQSVHASRTDIYTYFYVRGLALTKEKTGILCFITSKKWMDATYGRKLRNFFLNRNPLLLIDCGNSVFENVTADTNIILVQNSEFKDYVQAVILDFSAKNSLANFVKSHIVVLKNLSEAPWSISSVDHQDLKLKIAAAGIPLRAWNLKIYFGIKTGLNEAFIIDQTVRDQLIREDKKSAEIIMPVLRGRDIKRYSYEFARQYLIISGFGDYKYLPTQFPAVYRHLQKFEESLKARGQCLGSRSGKTISPDYQGQHHWLELDNNPTREYFDIFKKEKVMWKRIGSIIRFALVEEPIYGLDSTCVMVGDHVKYITAILNSKLGHYLLQDSPTTGTGDLILSVQAIDRIHVPVATESNQQIVSEIEELVEQITNLKLKNPSEDTRVLEEKIDLLVYDLFGLSEGDIRVIEEGMSIRREV